MATLGMRWMIDSSRVLPEFRKVPRLPRHFALYAGTEL